MTTKPNNDTKTCDHDWTPSLYEAGTETCSWSCGASRSAPAAPVIGVDIPRGFVVAVCPWDSETDARERAARGFFGVRADARVTFGGVEIRRAA